jgi:hypothetical protein
MSPHAMSAAHHLLDLVSTDRISMIEMVSRYQIKVGGGSR